MPHADLDLAGLARYLHLDRGQVEKMAQRGQVPGRKVAGQWRFNRSEIHHWLEERIGAAQDGELSHMAEALDRDANVRSDVENVRLAELLSPDTIAWPLAARTRSAVIVTMTKLAESTGWLWDQPRLAEAVRIRESLHPTALENGVALLHPRRPLADVLAQSFLCLGRTEQGIPFGSSQLTDLFFLICVRSDAEHLRLLARLSRLLALPGWLALLRQARTGAEAYAVVVQGEETLG
jgi:PTS system nitrogen regulatory IIA component